MEIWFSSNKSSIFPSDRTQAFCWFLLQPCTQHLTWILIFNFGCTEHFLCPVCEQFILYISGARSCNSSTKITNFLSQLHPQFWGINLFFFSRHTTHEGRLQQTQRYQSSDKYRTTQLQKWKYYHNIFIVGD